MCLVSRDHGWRFAIVVGDVDVRAVREQQIDHLPIPVLSGGMDRDPSSLLEGVDRGSMFHE